MSFPKPLEADLTDREGDTFPEPIRLPPITVSEVEEVILTTAPNKDTLDVKCEG